MLKWCFKRGSGPDRPQKKENEGLNAKDPSRYNSVLAQVLFSEYTVGSSPSVVHEINRDFDRGRYQPAKIKGQPMVERGKAEEGGRELWNEPTFIPDK